MPIDKNLIGRKLNFLNQHMSAAEHMEFTTEDFVRQADIHDLVTFRLQQAVEAAIDIATHIIAETDLPRKETAKDAFMLLGQEKIIDLELARKMAKAADFRNRVVHGYNDFDFRLLYKDYKENIKDLRNFGSQILKFLDKQTE